MNAQARLRKAIAFLALVGLLTLACQTILAPFQGLGEDLATLQSPADIPTGREEDIPIMDVCTPMCSHAPDGTEVEYNSNPPTSGPHYAQPLPAGFYDPQADPDNVAFHVPHPEGHLVHNLEHGYVIFWYNCSLLTDVECAQLKDEIRAVMDVDPLKVIAFPWDSTDVPVVMTSWGRMLRMAAFDAAAAARFIANNRNRAPEPSAP